MREAGRIACLSGAIAFGLLLSSCSDPAAEADTDPGEPGALRGILLSGTADYFDEDRTEKVYGLRKKDGSLVSLQFSDRPRVVTGSEVLVWGAQRADGLHVERLKVVKDVPREGIGQQGSSLIDPPPLMPPLKAAFVSVTPTYTKAMLDARILRDDFITPMLEVSSYGRWTMTWDTYGPFTIPNDCGGSFYDNVGKNGVAAMQAAGIDTTQYNQIQFIIPNTLCGWGGFGWDGKTPIRTNGGRGEYNPWSYVKDDFEGVMVQEIGHNWGLAHEHFCPNTQTPNSNPRCAGYVEYGSPFTPMSSTDDVYLNAWERIQMNFFSGCNVLTVGTSGSYDIGSINLPCNGPQVLRIKADKAEAGDFHRYYYIEYRTPVGIEKTNGVIVHYAADIKKGGWSNCDWGGPDCPEDFLINPIGATRQTALLPAGSEWTTPQGVGIKIVSLGEAARFELKFPTEGDGPTCLDGEPWDCKPLECKGSTGNPDPGAGPAINSCTGMDGGSGDSGPTADSGTGTGGTGGTGGTTTGGGTTDDESGCSCRVPGRRAPGGLSAVAAVAALGTASRWRRRLRAKTRS
jgi:hypothetical protein